jgi:acyl carrier protein
MENHDMDKVDIKARVEKVTALVLKVDPKEITPTANFAFDLGADSMQSIELIAAFEEEFNIQMDEQKAREVQTVEAAVDFIAGYLK